MLTLLAALVPVIALAVLGSTVEVPFVALGPGPTVNTLGDNDKGDPVVAIMGPGAQLDTTTGNLNMTTVTVRDGLTIFEALGMWASGRQGLVPRAEVFPPEKSREEIEKGNQADFQESEDSAEVAALHYLKYPFDVSIGTVSPDGPAKDALREDDVLISINDTDVTSACAVQQAVSSAGPRSTAVIRYTRDGVESTVDIPLGARPDDDKKGYLGIGSNEEPKVDFTVDFDLPDIGGPSAGLMFSLAVIDKLSPGELSGGKFVAGTGTIDACGQVGPIGGIPYKMLAAREAGAETFLVPAENCQEAKQRKPDGLRLVKVEKVDDAVSSLESIRAGGEAPTC